MADAFGVDVGDGAEELVGVELDEQVRHLRRKYERHLPRAIIVRPKLDCFLVEVREKLLGKARHANFRVPLRRRRGR